jgi:hypothetical protein
VIREELSAPLPREKDQFKLLAVKHLVPTKVHSDGGFNHLTPFFNSRNIQHDICGAGTHIGIVENKIKCLKNRCRSIIHSLPYVLPNSLVKYLVSFASQCVNMVQTVNSPHASPLECMIGRKLDFNVDLRVAFGDYCQVHCADMDNSLDRGTSGAIALLPSHNLRGSVTFFDLNTLRVIKRDSFKRVPSSAEIINRINSIAIAGHQTSSIELRVTKGHGSEVVSDDEIIEIDPLPGPLLNL